MRRLRLAVLSAGVVIGIALTWTMWAKFAGSSVRQTTFAAIQPGMSQEEVEALLGGPPGNYRTGQYKDFCHSSLPYFPIVTLLKEGARVECWEGDEAYGCVAFDKHHRVILQSFWTSPQRSASLGETLTFHFGQLKRRLGL